MALTAGSEWVNDPEQWFTDELGSALVEWARESWAAECRWLRVLAELDRRQGWAIDGQLSAKD
ncbi:MAG: hypothetical protein M3179_09635 [Actinomycetota bacterium]|nr:hypothetical protein [Actinomycetota bacterium]